MGVSRRSLVFGKGKRPPSEEDCAENTLRIITASTYREKPTESPTQSPTRALNMIESGGEDESRENNNDQADVIENTVLSDSKKSTKRKAGTFWNTDEAMAFYEGVKEHGKNFEKIVLTLNRKKLTKDKDQVRNYFYNTWKIYKEKASISENDWAHICQSAKELLVVTNALEWRKRTHSTNVNSVKFKNLVMTGTTTIKIPGKRVPISIRTPNCPALHKFFPSLKQTAKMPNSIKIQLSPNTYASKRYVLNCEQNPLLTISVNTQSAVSTLFKFLEHKWQKLSSNDAGEQALPTIVLYPPEGFKPSKVVIQPAVDSHPSVKSFPGPTSNHSKEIQPKIASNMFEILEDQLINGLTNENVLNTSFLHLYYLFNQQSTLRLRYDIITNIRSSNVFIKLSELIRNSEGITDSVKIKKKSNATPEFAVPQTNASTAKRLPNFRMAVNVSESSSTNVVDNERARFKEQLMALRQNSKDPQKIGKTSDKVPNKRMCMSAVTSPVTHELNVSMQDSSLEESLDSFGFPHFRSKRSNKTSHQKPTSSSVFDEDMTHNSLLPSPSKSLQEDAYRYFCESITQNSNDLIANFSDLIDSSQSALE